METNRNGIAFTVGGMGFCLIIYLSIGLLSIYAFGYALEGNVLDNISRMPTWESYVLRGIFLLVISTHTPFVFFVGKEALLTLIA